MFKINKESIKETIEKKKRLCELRNHFVKMDVGKRLLLKDGRIGIFKGFEGDEFSGVAFHFEENGVIKEIPLELYDSVLVSNPHIKCLLCGGDRIMDGVLRSYNDTFTIFRENITASSDITSTVNSRKIHLHACRDCGYIMPFVNIKSSNQF